jgi:hypothetical protein
LCNAASIRYPVKMAASQPHARLLDQLRASTRLAAFVLLLFAMKIGVAAACVGHDMVDLGFGTKGGHTSQLQAPTGADGDGDRTPGAPAHANSGCAHSHCHQAADVIAAPSHVVLLIQHSLEIDVDLWPLHSLLQDQLRPPIV